MAAGGGGAGGAGPGAGLQQLIRTKRCGERRKSSLERGPNQEERRNVQVDMASQWSGAIAGGSATRRIDFCILS